MGGFVTLRRHGFPFLERWISDRLDPHPTLHAFRPADFSPLITGVSHRVIRNRIKPAFLLGEAENMIVNPVFQSNGERACLDRRRGERFRGLEEAWAPAVEDSGY